MDVYGYGPRAAAMGMAYTGLADDYSATYYNPAGLAQIPRNTFAAGYFYADPRLSLRLTPAAFATRGQRAAVGRLARHQERVDGVAGYFAGMTLQITDYLAVGIASYLPQGFAIRLDPTSSRVPSFVTYENHEHRLVALVAAALRPIHQVSIGAGVSILADAKGLLTLPVEFNNRNLSLDPDQPAQEKVSTNAKLRISFPLTLWPFAGVLVTPSKWFSIGATYRSHFEWDVRIKVDAALGLTDYLLDLDTLRKLAPNLFPLRAVISVNIPNLGGTLQVPVVLDGLSGTLQVTARLPIQATLDVREFWTPQQVTLGGAVHPFDRGTFTLDLVWQNWSAMPAPDLKVKIEDLNVSLSTVPTTLTARIRSVSLPVIGTIGPLPPVNLSIPAISVGFKVPIDIAKAYTPRAHDVVIPRVGFEYKLGPSPAVAFLGRVTGAVRAGYGYEPSHLSRPNGFSNLIDLDRHILTVGAGVTARDMVTLDLVGQFHYLPGISATRDFLDPDTPYTKLRASGFVLAGGATVKVSW